MMKKEKIKRLYHQKYRPEWESFPTFAHWLSKSSNGYSAHCRICDVNVLPRLASIKQHHSTKKHQDGLKCNEFMTKHMLKPTPMEENTPKSKPKRPVPIAPPKHDEDSNDSILEDLLGGDDGEREFLDNNQQPSHLQQEMKIEEFDVEGLHEDAMSEEHVMSEFDFFGKSVALQLNHMALEDALLCQDRLQSVLTEFRLKILKRQREGKRSV